MKIQKSPFPRRGGGRQYQDRQIEGRLFICGLLFYNVSPNCVQFGEISPFTENSKVQVNEAYYLLYPPDFSEADTQKTGGRTTLCMGVKNKK